MPVVIFNLHSKKNFDDRTIGKFLVLDMMIAEIVKYHGVNDTRAKKVLSRTFPIDNVEDVSNLFDIDYSKTNDVDGLFRSLFYNVKLRIEDVGFSELTTIFDAMYERLKGKEFSRLEDLYDTLDDLFVIEHYYNFSHRTSSLICEIRNNGFLEKFL